MVYDTVVFVQQSIDAVNQDAVRSAVTVVIVVVVFLQNWRATLIPLLAVPVS